MSQSSAILKASLRAGATIGVGLWIALSFACSDATLSGPSGRTVSGGIQGSDAGAAPAEEAGTEDAAVDAAVEATSGPVYNGAPGATQAPMQSGSIAAPDGSCPIPDSLGKSGILCPSCAQSHCASALSECDPTMVSACTNYYCPKECISPDAVAASACPILVSCCPMLFGMSLYNQCFQAQAGGVPSTCASFLTQAQGSGHCK